MSDYSTTTAAIIQQAKTLEETLPIRNEACRSLFFFHPHPTAKVCLLFHGFTAGPYQFEPLGLALFQAGYNVLVPLQPGHGVAGNWHADNPPPLPTEREVYEQFALSWLKVSQLLGNVVVVGGLSTGGILAASMAFAHPQEIKQAVLFAPYVSGNNKMVDFLVEVLPIYYEWLNKDNPGNFGYNGFRIPALRLFLDLGQELLKHVENHGEVPMLIISSQGDAAVDENELQALFSSLVQHQPKSWYYRFDKFFKVPHTMMTIAEGNQYQDLLITIVKAYLSSDITWHELIELGNHILQGQTFENAASNLNLAQRVSPDVSVLLAVMDKKMMIDAYKETSS